MGFLGGGNPFAGGAMGAGLSAGVDAYGQRKQLDFEQAYQRWLMDSKMKELQREWEQQSLDNQYRDRQASEQKRQFDVSQESSERQRRLAAIAEATGLTPEQAEIYGSVLEDMGVAPKPKEKDWLVPGKTGQQDFTPMGKVGGYTPLEKGRVEYGGIDWGGMAERPDVTGDMGKMASFANAMSGLRPEDQESLWEMMGPKLEAGGFAKPSKPMGKVSDARKAVESIIKLMPGGNQLTQAQINELVPRIASEMGINMGSEPLLSSPTLSEREAGRKETETKANVTLKGAQTGKVTAETGKVKAQTQKTYAETGKVKAETGKVVAQTKKVESDIKLDWQQFKHKKGVDFSKLDIDRRKLSQGDVKIAQTDKRIAIAQQSHKDAQADKSSKRSDSLTKSRQKTVEAISSIESEARAVMAMPPGPEQARRAAAVAPLVEYSLPQLEGDLKRIDSELGVAHTPAPKPKVPQAKKSTKRTGKPGSKDRSGRPGGVSAKEKPKTWKERLLGDLTR